MRYSLIVPHYNDTVRLERLLQGVPAERADLEILVVDDCSLDQAAIAQARQRWPRVRWLSTAKNSGAGAARNVGLAQARGDYLLFADSDDQFLPGAFDMFDAHLAAPADLVYFLAQARQDVDDAPSMRVDWLNRFCHAYLEAPSDATLKALKLNHVVPWAKVYARAFIQSIGTRFEEVRYGNDVAFNVLSALRAGRVRVAPVPVYVYFTRSGSLTADPSPDAFLVRVGNWVRLASALKAFDLEREYFPKKSGLMLKALFGHGPFTAYRAWRLVRHSDLRPLQPLRALNPILWVRFLRNFHGEYRERSRASHRPVAEPASRRDSR